MFKKILKWIWNNLPENIHKYIDKLIGNPVFAPFIRKLISLFYKKNVQIRGNKMFINPGRNPAIAFYDIRGYEETETNLFESYIKEGDVVLDLGANIGYYTLVAAKNVGKSGKVYAFEPDPENFAYLKKNVEINNYQNVVCVQKAVSNVNGMSKLYLHKFQTGAYTLFGKGDDYVEIETVRLDDFFKDKNHRVDMIKLDIEGSEGIALVGAQKILKENKNIKIISEILPDAMKKSAVNTGQLFNLLIDYGFSIYQINDKSNGQPLKLINPSQIYEFISEIKIITNIFCIRENN